MVSTGRSVFSLISFGRHTETTLQFVFRPAGGSSGGEAHHGPAHSQLTLLLQPIGATELPLVSAVVTLPTIDPETGSTHLTGHPTPLRLQGHTGVKGQRTHASAPGANEEGVQTLTQDSRHGEKLTANHLYMCRCC